MTEETTQTSQIPKKPDWLNEFKRRTALIDVIEKAFDPNVSDAEVRQGLIKAAETLKDFMMPENS